MPTDLMSGSLEMSTVGKKTSVELDAPSMRTSELRKSSSSCSNLGPPVRIVPNSYRIEILRMLSSYWLLMAVGVLSVKMAYYTLGKMLTFTDLE